MTTIKYRSKWRCLVCFFHHLHYFFFFASWRLVDAYARLRFDLAFLLLLSFVPHGMYCTPQIKLPTKSSLLQTRARNLNKKNYRVPTEDVKLLRRNLRACLQEVTSSFRLFKDARSALQMMKYFPHRHKLQRFEGGLIVRLALRSSKLS